RGQLPGERFERRAVLPHDRDFPAWGERDDRDVIGLLDRVIGLRRGAARKLHLARDDAHPRRHRRGASRAYARPVHVIAGISADPSTDIGGLDPAIHLLRSKDVCSMDARVKPGYDGMDGPMIVGVISAAP